MVSLETVEELRRQHLELAARADELSRQLDDSRDQHSEFEACFNEAPLALLIIDENGMIARGNRRASDLLGIPWRFLVGRALMSYVRPDDHAAMAKCLRRAVAGDELHPSESRPVEIHARDGGKSRVLVRASQLFSSRSLIQLSLTEISDVDVNETRLRSLEESLRCVSKIVPFFTYRARIIGEHLSFTSCTGDCHGISGFTARELVEVGTWRNLVEPRDRMKLVELRQGIASNRSTTVEFRVRAAEGDVRWWQLFASPGLGVSDEAEDENLRFHGAILDITRRKLDSAEQARLEEALRQSQKMEALGRLAGGVAHDFNNLLTAIIGNISLLQSTDPRKDQVELFEGVEMAANRAKVITEELLAFGRKQLFALADHDVGKVVRKSMPLLRQLVPDSIRFDCRVPASPIYAKLDDQRLVQALMNLCVNARDAVDTDGEIQIAVDHIHLEQELFGVPDRIPAGDHVRIAVLDNGRGFSREVRENMFEPFYTTKRVGEGTGLGLSMVYGVLRQFDGQIQAESHPNRGSRFTLFVPKVAEEDAAVLEDDESSSELAAENAGQLAPQARTESLLVVEDEDSIRRLLDQVLTLAGFAVRTAANGEAAIEIVRSGEVFDLIVSDVVMPRMNGLDLCSALRADLPEVPVIFMSGFAEDSLAEAPHSSCFLRKPFTPIELVDLVDRVLASDGPPMDELSPPDAPPPVPE